MSDSRLASAAGLVLAGGFFLLSLGCGHQQTPPTGSGPLLAVIPTLGIGGPLAILALLFPSLFGGVLVLFRQWGAYFMVISVDSLLYCLWDWCAGWLTESWWGTRTALWLTITLVTLAGMIWSWRRSVTALRTGNMPEAPARTEMLVLWLLSISCVIMFVVHKWFALPWSLVWILVLILAAGLWAGTAYKVYRRVAAPGSLAGDLPTEAVMLGTMLAGCILFIGPAGGRDAGFSGTPGQQIARRDKDKVAKILLSRFDPHWGVDWDKGAVFSSPLVAGDHVFAAMAETDDVDQTKGKGAVFCIDRKTQKIVWTFTDEMADPMTGGKKIGMQPVFSRPTVADGRLYIGEGFHYNPNCKLYCLDVKTGHKLWEFQTTSQIEGSPCVSGGRVYFGAGNDGIYAVDAKTGKEVWHKYPQGSRIFRVGAGAIVVDGKLYVGSGVDREQPETCDMGLVCLDAETGQELWKVPANRPCWAAPVLDGDVVFFTLGSGDVFFDGEETPGGAVLCLNAKTGKQVWRYDVPKGVHTRPAVDVESVYVGSRDGNCYCLNRFDGTKRWASFLGTPIFASPALYVDWHSGKAVSVFVATEGDTEVSVTTGSGTGLGGKLVCLDAQTGEIHWEYLDLQERKGILVASPAVAVIPTPEGVRRQIYFGVWLKGANQPYLYCVEDVLTTVTAKKGEGE